MSPVNPFPSGGYAWLGAEQMPFSRGVIALPGYSLVRVCLHQPLPLAEGFASIAALLKARGRPIEALAAVEIRSPRALSFADFAEFNRDYIGQLQAIGLAQGERRPIARSNMAPLDHPPASNRLFAFTYTRREDDAAGGDFVISGIPELKRNPVAIVAPDDLSDEGMRAKIDYVIGALREVASLLGADWSRITAAQAYCPARWDCIMPALKTAGLDGIGLTLFPARPPVVGLDFEVDVRAVGCEEVVRYASVSP